MDPTLPVEHVPLANAVEETEPSAPVQVAQQPSVFASAPAVPSAFENAEPEEDGPAKDEGTSAAQPAPVPTTLASSAADPFINAHTAEPIAPAETTHVTGDEDDDMNVLLGGATASGDAEDDHQSGLPSMKDLFGPFFKVDDLPEEAADPALVDTRSVLETHFGAYVLETDVVLQNEAEVLAREMRANKKAREEARVQQLFGMVGPEILRQEAQEKFTVLRSTVPPAPKDIFAADTEEEGAEKKDVWLVEMPRMLPNRQTLHADPQPFFPTRCELLESDDRALYTPHNVLRWTHHGPTNTYMSNARVVRWSDGSHTLHVGSDTYSLDSTKSNAAAHILGSQTTITKGDVTLPAITKTLNPGKHFVVESTEARSIERAVLAESAQHLTKTQRMKLAYAQAPLPEVDWTKPNAARNPQEEYVAMEYERRSKELQRRFKEGRPMSLREQLEADAQLFQQLSSANVEELLERQREERRQAALHAARRAQLTADGQRAGRSRLDRDAGLAALGVSADPFLDYGEDGEDGDEEHGATSEDSADDDIEAMMERKRQRQEAEDHKRDVQYASLISALEDLLGTIPASNESAYGEVEGFLTYMKGNDFSASILNSEVPLLLESVAKAAPEADLTGVEKAFKALPLS